MGIEDEIILSINRSTLTTSHRTAFDFDLSIDGYFSDQVPWTSWKFISGKTTILEKQ